MIEASACYRKSGASARKATSVKKANSKDSTKKTYRAATSPTPKFYQLEIRVLRNEPLNAFPEMGRGDILHILVTNSLQKTAFLEAYHIEVSQAIEALESGRPVTGNGVWEPSDWEMKETQWGERVYVLDKTVRGGVITYFTKEPNIEERIRQHLQDSMMLDPS